MGLSKKTLDWIAELSGVKAEDITAGITSEKEVEIKRPQGEFFTDDDLSKRDGSKYREGKEAGEEMLIKGFKKKYGYDIEGKDSESFFSHHDDQLKTKYSKGSTDRVKELENDLLKQKKAFDKDMSDKDGLLVQMEQKATNQTIDNSLLFASPKEMTMDAKRVIALFKMENPPLKVGDVFGVAGPDGQPLKNPKTGELIPHTEIYKEWVVKENFVKANPGRGGGNEFGQGSKFTSKTPGEFQREWEKLNPGTSNTSPKFDTDYAEWRKNNKETAA